MDCICRHMERHGTEMSGNPTHKSKMYKNFYLYENYGSWRLIFSDGEGNDFWKNVEIFYCPFCGRRLNMWPWSVEKAKMNFKDLL